MREIVIHSNDCVHFIGLYEPITMSPSSTNMLHLWHWTLFPHNFRYSIIGSLDWDRHRKKLITQKYFSCWIVQKWMIFRRVNSVEEWPDDNSGKAHVWPAEWLIRHESCPFGADTMQCRKKKSSDVFAILCIAWTACTSFRHN